MVHADGGPRSEESEPILKSSYYPDDKEGDHIDAAKPNMVIMQSPNDRATELYRSGTNTMFMAYVCLKYQMIRGRPSGIVFVWAEAEL